jgi:hypothetical protein
MTKITETDFLEMPDRNQWIAKHIMGWTEIHEEEIEGVGGLPSFTVYMGVPPGASGEYFEQLDDYENWEGAGRIIEKMRERGWQVTLILSLNYGNLCVMSLDDTIVTGQHHREDTAVALAAGRAMGEIE